jgi:hypothetical protein
MAPPMSPHGQRHLQGTRPLCSFPHSPLRVAAAVRWIRLGRGPPEFVQTRTRVPATPGGTLGASLVTVGEQPRDARPQTVATVLECASIPSDGWCSARFAGLLWRRGPGRVHES